MIRELTPGPRCGCVKIPASKSQAHRLLIVAALGEGETRLRCDGISKDIAATIACLRALGAEIREEDGALLVRPRLLLRTGALALGAWQVAHRARPLLSAARPCAFCCRWSGRSARGRSLCARGVCPSARSPRSTKSSAPMA